MSGLRAAWTSFWFDKEDPSALAMVRIAFYGFLVLTSRKFWGSPLAWARSFRDRTPYGSMCCGPPGTLRSVSRA
jgi:hypothetical protein